MTRRPAFLLVSLCLVVSVALVACGGTSTGSASPMATASAGATVTASADVGASPSSGPASAEPSSPPSALPTAATPSEPTTGGPTGSEPPGSQSPSAEPPGDPAVACTGTAENRAFFAAAAAAVDWPVLCLGDPGWFVTKGSYRLADGGHLDIGYRGPGGATVSFQEGYICGGEGCAPQGTIVRDTALGELGNAQLIELADGRVAIVADPDANPSWILTGTGMTADQLEKLAAGFATVGG